jgi:predicted membrane-bound spermidine synthase
MDKQRKPSRMKAALIGAFVCGLLGPTLGALAMLSSEVAHAQSARAAALSFGALPWVWPFAMMLVGPTAFVFGGVGAIIIQFISAKVPSTKILILQTTALGIALGSAVPIVVSVIDTTLWGGWNKNFATELLPLGAVTGVVSATATYCLLHRMGLLDFQQSQNFPV